MAEFNYREFLKNNPLLKEEVKDSLITESKTINEGIPQEEDSKAKTSISSAEFERIKNSPEIEKLAAAVAKDPKAVANIEKVIQKSGALNEMAGDIEANDISKIAQAIDTLNEEEEVGGGNVILTGLLGAPLALYATDSLEMVNNLLNLSPSSVIGPIAAMAVGAVLGAVYAKIKGLKENIEEEKPSSKMKVSEFKAKIKEEILAALTEADKNEEEDVEVEDVEAEMDVEEPTMAPEVAPEEGLTADEQEIQDSLKIAYDNAVQIGDDKLADQIGNTITFFTRSHVVNK